MIKLSVCCIDDFWLHDAPHLLQLVLQWQVQFLITRGELHVYISFKLLGLMVFILFIFSSFCSMLSLRLILCVCVCFRCMTTVWICGALAVCLRA